MSQRMVNGIGFSIVTKWVVLHNAGAQHCQLISLFSARKNRYDKIKIQILNHFPLNN